MTVIRQAQTASSDATARPHAAAACSCGGLKLHVAFASSDLRHVDEHFGSATRFARYEVACRTTTLLGAAEFDETQQDGNEAKLVTKLKTLSDCQVMYCQAVGASAVRQLLAAGIQPIKVGGKASIEEVLDHLVEEIHAGRTPWIEKLKQKTAGDDGRFDAMLDEAWEE